MHELGIAKDLFRQLADAAAAHGMRKVDRVVLKLGILTGIEHDHLAEHLAEEAVGSALAEARYEFLDLAPGDELSPEESGAATAAPPGSADSAPYRLRATGFEVIIAKMEGR